MIKVGILGYGNLGRGVEAAIKKNDDMELVAVYTRRDPSTLTIKTPTAAVKSTADLDTGKEELDILVICGGSATDLPEMTVYPTRAQAERQGRAIIASGWREKK